MGIELSLKDKLKLRIRGSLYVGHKKKDEWTDEFPFYVFKCPIHGLVEDYPHGWKETLSCPKCVKGVERVYQKNLRSSYQILDEERYERYWWGRKPSTKKLFEEWLKEPKLTMRAVSMRHGLNSCATLSRVSQDLQRKGIMIRHTSEGSP